MILLWVPLVIIAVVPLSFLITKLTRIEARTRRILDKWASENDCRVTDADFVGLIYAGGRNHRRYETWMTDQEGFQHHCWADLQLGSRDRLVNLTWIEPRNELLFSRTIVREYDEYFDSYR